MVVISLRIHSVSSASVRAKSPGASSEVQTLLIGLAAAISRTRPMARISGSRSELSDR